MASNEVLTKRQTEVLSAIRNEIAHTGSSPTLQKLKDILGVKSLRSVTQYLESLERKGLIERGRYKKQGIRLIGDSKNSDQQTLVQIPVFASAGCGSPTVIAQRNFDEFISIDPRLIKRREDTFVIKATGKSMVDAGIDDGDFVLVEKTSGGISDIKDGDIVVAIIDGNAVIKRINLKNKNKMVVLSPVTKDSSYKPILVHQNFPIFGKMIEIIKVEHDNNELKYIYE